MCLITMRAACPPLTFCMCPLCSSVMDLVVSVTLPLERDVAAGATTRGHDEGSNDALELLYGLPDSFNALYIKGGALAYLPSWARDLISLCVEISDDLQGEQTPLPDRVTDRRTVSFADTAPGDSGSHVTPNRRLAVHGGRSVLDPLGNPCSSWVGDDSCGEPSLTADAVWVWTLLESFLGFGCDALWDDESAYGSPAGKSPCDRPGSRAMGLRHRSQVSEAIAAAARVGVAPSGGRVARRGRVQVVDSFDIPQELLESPRDSSDLTATAEAVLEVSAVAAAANSGGGIDNPGLRARGVLQPLSQEERQARAAEGSQRQAHTVYLDDFSDDEAGPPARAETQQPLARGGGSFDLPSEGRRLCPRRLRYRVHPADSTAAHTPSPLQLVSTVFNRQLSAQALSMKRLVASQLFYIASGGPVEDSLLVDTMVASGLAHLFCSVCTLLLSDIAQDQALALVKAAASPPPLRPSYRVGGPPTRLQRVSERILRDYLMVDYLGHSSRFVHSVYTGNYNFSGEKQAIVQGGISVLSSVKAGCGYAFLYSVVTLLVRHHDVLLKRYCSVFGDLASGQASPVASTIEGGPSDFGSAPVYVRAQRVSRSESLYRSIVGRLMSALGPTPVGSVAAQRLVTPATALMAESASGGSGSVMVYLSVLSVFFTYVVASHYRRRGFRFHSLEWLQKCFLIKLRKTYAQLVETVRGY
jgi:hypothetical protein